MSLKTIRLQDKYLQKNELIPRKLFDKFYISINFLNLSKIEITHCAHVADAGWTNSLGAILARQLFRALAQREGEKIMSRAYRIPKWILFCI
jgi:hypothetical protein